MHSRAITISSACVVSLLVTGCGADPVTDGEPQESAVPPGEPSTSATTTAEETGNSAEPTLVDIPDVGGYVWRFAVAPTARPR